MTPKKVPERQCIACREMKNKKDLIRIVRTPEGIIGLDFTGKKNGRGAYVCNSEACIKRVCKSRMVHKAFKTSVSDEVYAAIEKEFHDNQSEN